MKTYEVRFVEVYRVKAETETEAYELALASYSDDDAGLTDEELDRIDYQHGDDSTKEI